MRTLILKATAKVQLCRILALFSPQRNNLIICREKKDIFEDMKVLNSEIPCYFKSMNEGFLSFKKCKTKSYQDEDGQVCCIQQAKQ